MMSTYVDNGLVSTEVDDGACGTGTTPHPASPAALLPDYLAEVADHIDEELADDRLVGRAHEAERGLPLRSGLGVVVLADAPALAGHVQPDHPPVAGIPAPLHIALTDQGVDHRGQRAGRGPAARRHVARLA